MFFIQVWLFPLIWIFWIYSRHSLDSWVWFDVSLATGCRWMGISHVPLIHHQWCHVRYKDSWEIFSPANVTSGWADSFHIFSVSLFFASFYISQENRPFRSTQSILRIIFRRQRTGSLHARVTRGDELARRPAQYYQPQSNNEFLQTYWKVKLKTSFCLTDFWKVC